MHLVLILTNFTYCSSKRKKWKKEKKKKRKGGERGKRERKKEKTPVVKIKIAVVKESKK